MVADKPMARSVTKWSVNDSTLPCRGKTSSLPPGCGRRRRSSPHSVNSHYHLIGGAWVRVRILNLGFATWRVLFVVFESIKILVSFAAGMTSIWFGLFHTFRAFVRDVCLWVHN